MCLLLWQMMWASSYHDMGVTHMQEGWSPRREGNLASQLVRADSDEMLQGKQKLTSDQKRAKEDLLVSLHASL